jgi:hypothetical protein
VAHQISNEERPYWGDHWRWTSMSAKKIFAEVFSQDKVLVEAHGNVLIAIALLHGLVREELHASDFEYDDPAYEVSILIRTQKE